MGPKTVSRPESIDKYSYYVETLSNQLIRPTNQSINQSDNRHEPIYLKDTDTDNCETRDYIY